MVRLRSDVQAPIELDQLWSLRPRFHELFMREYNRSLRRVDPVLLELCRLRMAEVFGCDALSDVGGHGPRFETVATRKLE